MNEQKELITPIKNSEDQAKVIAKYKDEIKEHKQKALDWQNASTNKDDTILEKDKHIERLEAERDDWKKEALARQKVYQETKQYKETTDFLTEFKKNSKPKRVLNMMKTNKPELLHLTNKYE